MAARLRQETADAHRAVPDDPVTDLGDGVVSRQPYPSDLSDEAWEPIRGVNALAPAEPAIPPARAAAALGVS